MFTDYFCLHFTRVRTHTLTRAQSRGGILEAEGLVDVKFRRADMLRAARRWDAQLAALDRECADLDAAIAAAQHELKTASASANTSVAASATTMTVTIPSGAASSAAVESLVAQRAAAQKRVVKREALLYPVFHQVCICV